MENNATMTKENQDIITGIMGVEPIYINSNLLTAQERKRLYWTNIPDIKQPEDKGIFLRDIVQPREEKKEYECYKRMMAKEEGTLAHKKAWSQVKTLDQKSRALTTAQNISNSGATNIKYSDTEYYILTPLECERLQTLPDNYTEGVSNTQRYKAIGNGWTVDVIRREGNKSGKYDRDREVLYQQIQKERYQQRRLKKAGHSVIEIAEQLGVHRSTIYNELKRGEYMHRNSDYTETLSYSPNKAQMKAEENLKARGTQLKIGNDIAYANYIEDKIVNEDYSPAAVLGELKAQGKEGDFSVTVCVTTLYSYIDKGIFLKLSNKNLPVKKNKKRNYKKVQRQQKRAAAGESIDKRPKEIDTREEFGNWEMDSVLGKRGKSKNTLLVLTERKTRNEIIFKLPDHTDEAVVAALDRLERKWGADMFKRVFKTITVDNGSEFADAEGLQRSIINEGEKRTKVYYCHPYSSWERGTNEVTNKMIRRKIPKGTNFDDRTEEEVESIENWINGYPRKIHGYHSAGELFEEEVKQLA